MNDEEEEEEEEEEDWEEEKVSRRACSVIIWYIISTDMILSYVQSISHLGGWLLGGEGSSKLIILIKRMRCDLCRMMTWMYQVRGYYYYNNYHHHYHPYYYYYYYYYPQVIIPLHGIVFGPHVMAAVLVL